MESKLVLFDPTQHGLDESFKLTNFSDLRGWGCKIPQKVLAKLLEGIQLNENSSEKIGEQIL